MELWRASGESRKLRKLQGKRAFGKFNYSLKFEVKKSQ